MMLGDIEVGKLPLVVGTVCTDLNFPVDVIEKIDILEVRVDMLPVQNTSDVIRIVRSIKHKYGKPIIATVRSKDEGGLRQIDDDQRYDIFKEIIQFAEILDVELSSKNLVEKILLLCKEHNKYSMLSYHNLSETPKNNVLENIIQKGKKLGAAFVKIAAKANHKEDLSNLIHFTIENRNAGIVTISLGSIGLASRLINPLIGSLMTYGYIDAVSAPGQISAFDIIEHIRLLDPVYNEALIERLKLLEAV